MWRSTEKPVCVYKLRPRVIGACHRRQLPVRSFIVSVKKKKEREEGKRSLGREVVGYSRWIYPAYNGSKWPNYRAKFECAGEYRALLDILGAGWN